MQGPQICPLGQTHRCALVPCSLAPMYLRGFVGRSGGTLFTSEPRGSLILSMKIDSDIRGSIIKRGCWVVWPG
jgi:hypothetical protein